MIAISHHKCSSDVLVTKMPDQKYKVASQFQRCQICDAINANEGIYIVQLVLNKGAP